MCLAVLGHIGVKWGCTKGERIHVSLVLVLLPLWGAGYLTGVSGQEPGGHLCHMWNGMYTLTPRVCQYE